MSDVKEKNSHLKVLQALRADPDEEGCVYGLVACCDYVFIVTAWVALRPELFFNCVLLHLFFMLSCKV